MKQLSLSPSPALPPRRPVTNTEELHTENTLGVWLVYLQRVIFMGKNIRG